MADGGIGNQSPASLFQARLLTANNVGPTLKLGQYNGNKVVVSGQTVVVPGTGLQVLVGDNLINATGADAGAAGAANTLYYVYISNQKSPFSPSSIRLSATPPIPVNGVKYLGNTGNALNWRFVGWVQLNATPNFESSLTRRTIVNYYNRLLATLISCPAYIDDDAAQTYVVNSAVYVPINGGVDDSLFLIANGEDAAAYSVSGACSTPDVLRVGIGVDSLTTPKVSTQTPAIAGGVGALFVETSDILAEGFHKITYLALSVAGLNSTVVADLPREGGTKDPFLTFIEANVYI